MDSHYEMQCLIITLPDCKLLFVIARSLLFACVIIAFPWIESILCPASSFSVVDQVVRRNEFLPLVLDDLMQEGLIKQGSKALFVGNGRDSSSYFLESSEDSQLVSRSKIHMHPRFGLFGKEFEVGYVSTVNSDPFLFQFEKESEMDFFSDLSQKEITDNTFDLVFAESFSATEILHYAIKIGGIAIVPLSIDTNSKFYHPPNFNFVYIRRFGSIIVAAMRKNRISTVSRRTGTLQTQRKLFAHKRCSEKPPLETLVLEPSCIVASLDGYLPNLTEYAPERYHPQIFVGVGDGAGKWFIENYPIRKKEFEMYSEKTAIEFVKMVEKECSHGIVSEDENRNSDGEGNFEEQNHFSYR